MAIGDPTKTDSTVIQLTEPAIARIRQLITERQLEGYALRVFISGGGCSGMQYGMALEGEPREADLRCAFDDVEVVIDPISMDYLRGATIDYVDDLMGGGFRIENPNALSSCGCGHSFRTASEGAAEHEHAQGGCGCGH
jgi:iron-sulfur cluster assembly accessory protein